MKLPTRILLIAATLVALHSARAQNAAVAPPPVKLEPLRVTADLWASPLERIPASVTICDENALRAGAVRHFGDLANAIPNLTFTGATSRPRYFQIRGIGENSQYEGETPDSAVRFLVDDLDFTGLGSIAGTFDLAQAEILRGPQAGAFGANAAGGVVRLVTNAPTPFWTGAIEGGAGGDALRERGFALGGPLSSLRPEALMARLAIFQSNSDGFRRNATLRRDTNARDEFTARLRLTANPSPLWHWDLGLLHADFDNGFDEFALDNNGRLTYSDQPGYDIQRSSAASLRGTFTGLEGVRFTTVTGGTWTKSRYAYDDDWTAASYMGFSDLRRQRDVFNQELRLDSADTRGALGWVDRWTLGGYYAELRENGAYTDSYPWEVNGLDTHYHSKNEAIFGQLAHDLSATTRLTLGLRAERVSISGRGTKTYLDTTTGTSATPIIFRPTFSGTLLGGKVTLEHNVSDHELVFASVTRGYKAGGVNLDARINPAGGDPLIYGNEALWNWEAGVRGAWLERRLTGELTAFHLMRGDAQVRDSAGFGGSYRFFTSNGRGARVSGLEASASYALTPGWSLRATVSQMDSYLDRFTLANGHSGGGRELANTPRYGYTLGTSWRDRSGWFAHADLVARAQQFDSNNQNESRRAFRLVNASLGHAWGRWTVTLWAKNLFDQRYEKRVFFFGNEDPNYVETRYEDRADPRQLGGSVAYRF